MPNQNNNGKGGSGKYKDIKKISGGAEDKSDGAAGFIVDLVLFLMPFIDKEIFELVLGAADTSVPGFDPIDLSEVSKLWLILFLFSPLPREMLRYIWDPLKTSGKGDSKKKVNYGKTGRAKGKRTGSSGSQINVTQKNENKEDERSPAVTVLKVFGGLLVFILILSFFFSVPGEYAEFAANEVNDRTAGLAAELGPVVRTYNTAKARVFCLLKGPACLRQWRLNQTTRPGTQEVGETYGLKVERFDVGQGDQLDIAYKDGDYEIPMSFTISNPRRGLKGINALDVQYRVRIIDGDNSLGDPLCDTGRKDVTTGYEINDEGGQNDIYPGTSASTDFLTHNEITLENCELLQPALGKRKTIVLDIYYDYFSQSTLYFEAMSRQNFQANPNLEKQWRESETADTPAKAAINLNSPVLYDEETFEPAPFRFRATVNTDKRDIEYRVTGLEVIRSRETDVLSDGEDCSFDQVKNRHFRPDDQSKQLIIFDKGADYTSEDEENLVDNERPYSYYWFASDERPPLIGCPAEINNTQQISTTGETLSMEVKANYTVKKIERKGGFEVYNSACSTINCPILITAQEDTEITDYDYLSVCEGVDAGNGCVVISPFYGSTEWGRVQRDAVAGARKIEDGEIAIRVQGEDGNEYWGGVDRRTWEELDGSGEKLDGDISTGLFYKSNYTLLQITSRVTDEKNLKLLDKFIDKAEVKDDDTRKIVKRWCPNDGFDEDKELGALVECSQYDKTDETSGEDSNEGTVDSGKLTKG